MRKKRRPSNKKPRTSSRPSSGGKRSGKASLTKKKYFDDFYADEIEEQREDFPVLCARHGYPSRFSPELLREAEAMRKDFDVRSKESDFLQQAREEGRVDLSRETIFTIDGDDAKDFDDAVSLEKTGGVYKLGVHIADGSYFIKENSPLDQEALRRGTSVYLINRVIPMFPEPISNHLCSLVEGEYRYTYSCVMEIDGGGEIRNYRFFRSLIKSIRRCTYREVEEVLNGGPSLGKRIDETLRLMDELKSIMRKRRIERGAINFSTDEQYFVLGDEKVEAVGLKAPLSSENLIEEFMLAANLCAAQEMNKFGAGIYRVHDVPRAEKIYSFERLMTRMGFKMPKSGSLNPLKDGGMNRYVIFLEGIEDPHVKSNLSFLLLISMSQAAYSVQNIGHYGLAFRDYTHFTSPIRRYPDLAVHRLVTRYAESRGGELAGKKKKKGNPLKELKTRLKKVAQLSSENERKAVDAEREYYKVKGMRYLHQFPDRVYDTIVMKAGENGLFVKELETGIEGFVSSYDLEPDLFFDPVRETFKRKKEVIYELGTQMQVRLSHLNFKKMFIDFKPV